MRKRLIAAVFILLLSFAPVYAGHSLAGGFWCDCNSPESHNIGLRIDESEIDNELTHNEQTNELDIFFSAVLLWLKLAA